MDFSIRKIVAADWPQIRSIYQEGIDTGGTTFLQEAHATFADWYGGKSPDFCFAAVQGDTLLGWIALSPTSSRYYYRGVQEISLYVAQAAWGKGVGSALMQYIIDYSEAHDVWTLTSLIFPQNETSMHLHEKFGFRIVGVREKPGLMTFGPYKGQWLDVAILERRSKIAGQYSE